MPRFALLALLAVLLYSLSGCAGLNKQLAQNAAGLALGGIEGKAADAMRAEVADLPGKSEADLRAWLVTADPTLTEVEIDGAVAAASHDACAVLAWLPAWLDGEGPTRLIVSALTAEEAKAVAPREAARALLAWATARSGCPD